MTTFALTIPGAPSVSITDAGCLAGLTSARGLANGSTNPPPYASDGAYLDHVLQGTTAADVPKVALRATRNYAINLNSTDPATLPPDPDAPAPTGPPQPPAVVVPNPAGLAAYAKVKQQAVMMSGTAINGVWVDTSIQGLVLLGGAIQLAQQQPTTNINWVSNGAAISLTPAQIIGLGVAIGNRTQSTFTTLGNVLAAIAGGSITTTSQIDAAAWPS